MRTLLFSLLLSALTLNSSVAISSRYVHPSEDAVLAAMARLSGHKIGHTAEISQTETGSPKLLTQ